MKEILFVCTGNTCRSPMAQAVCTKLLEQAGLTGEYRASSAGIVVMGGEGANEKSVAVCAKDGVMLEGHRARPLTEAMVRDAFLVLTMTEGHKSALVHHFPQYFGKVRTLSEYALLCDGQKFYSAADIPDPYGQSEAVYQKTYETIRGQLEKIVSFLARGEQ